MPDFLRLDDVHDVNPCSCGFLVASQNADQMAERITLIAENKDKVDAIGRNYRNDALLFDWKLLVAGYDRIYAAPRRQPHDGVM